MVSKNGTIYEWKMAVKNHIIRIKADEKMKNKIKEVCEKLQMTEPDITRLLLNNALKRLKADALKVGGLEFLEFTIVPN